MSELQAENRRQAKRREFHATIRFAPITGKPSPIHRGLSQNISLRGVQVLTKHVLEQDKVLELFVPVDKDVVIPVWGKVAWVKIEDGLSDSPYWVKTGIEFSFQESEHKELFESMISQDSSSPRGKILNISYVI